MLKEIFSGCDDGNLVEGDGCDKNCTVESGYICTNQVSYTSSCSFPQDATIQFLNGVSTYPGVPEGDHASILIERIGNNRTACNVTYMTIDSDAKHRASDNNDFTPANVPADSGDYAYVNGTVAFQPGQTVKSVEVEVYQDGCYDGAASETFVFRLTSTTCAFANDESHLDAFITIDDDDLAPTVQPTQLPTLRPSTSIPTVLPTTFPSIDCLEGQGNFRFIGSGNEHVLYVVYNLTNIESPTLVMVGDVTAEESFDWFCLSDSCYRFSVINSTTNSESRLYDGLSSITISGLNSIEFCVQGGYLEALPTPTPSLTLDPSSTPTSLPTKLPSKVPSAEPSDAPTSSFPSGSPSAVPSVSPTLFPSVYCGSINTYRFSVEPPGVVVFDYKIYNGTMDSEAQVDVVASGTVTSVGYVCLKPLCYVLSLNVKNSSVFATWTMTSTANHIGYTATFTTSAFHFCTTADGNFYALPTVAPTVSSVPSSMPASQPSGKPTFLPVICPTSIPSSSRPSVEPTVEPTSTPTSSPTTQPSPQPSVAPSPHPSPDCGNGIERSALYRYETDAGGILYSIRTIMESNATRNESLALSGELASSGYLCLSDACYIMTASAGSLSSTPGALTLKSSTDASFKVFIPVQKHQFCVKGGDIVKSPTSSPTISVIPTNRPTYFPTSSLPSNAPTQIPSENPTIAMPPGEVTTTSPSSVFLLTSAPVTTRTAVVVETSLGMTSEYNASEILANTALMRVLTMAISAASKYVRADDVLISNVKDVESRRSRLLQNVGENRLLTSSSDISVGFELSIFPTSFGLDMNATLVLVDTVTTNLSSFVNSGGMTSEVASAAALFNITTSIVVPVQAVSTTYFLRSVSSLDGVPTAFPSAEQTIAPSATKVPTSFPTTEYHGSRERSKKSNIFEFWLMMLIVAVVICTGVFLVTYGLLNIWLGAPRVRFRSAKVFTGTFNDGLNNAFSPNIKPDAATRVKSPGRSKVAASVNFDVKHVNADIGEASRLRNPPQSLRNDKEETETTTGIAAAPCDAVTQRLLVESTKDSELERQREHHFDSRPRELNEKVRAPHAVTECDPRVNDVLPSNLESKTDVVTKRSWNLPPIKRDR